ncbi:MAG: beta-lactamase induction protein [Rhodanobacter sp.]
MAVQLLVALIALAVLHTWPRLAQRPDDGMFRRWVLQLTETSGYARAALAVLPPVILCVVIWALLGHTPTGPWLQALFALAVLMYCLGPHEFTAGLEAILVAPDLSSRVAAAQHLSDDGSVVGWDARSLGTAIVYSALRRRFAVLLWFFVLGPAGALAYRLLQLLARDPALQRTEAEDAPRYLANAADWVPAQLLTFTLALVGHWEAVIAAWRVWRSHAAPTSWYRDEPAFLGAAAQADVRMDLSEDDAPGVERYDPLVELVRLRGTLLRALLGWLSVVALIVIGSLLR